MGDIEAARQVLLAMRLMGASAISRVRVCVCV